MSKRKGKTKQEIEDQKQRLKVLHQKLIESIFEKIPVLETEKDVYLGKLYFKKLTDEEFVLLWTLPNLIIRVHPNAADYLEERRLLLGLKRNMQSGVLRGADEKN